MIWVLKNIFLFISIVISLFSCKAQIDVDLVSKNSVFETTKSSDNSFVSPCSQNYIYFEGRNEAGSFAGNFCVAKYEMKAVNQATDEILLNSYGSGVLDVNLYYPASRPEGTPWVGITLLEAKAECISISKELMTNEQWQTVARTLEEVDENWHSGKLYKGHSDSVYEASGTCPNSDPVNYGTRRMLTACDGTNPYVGTGNNKDQLMGSGKEQRRTMITKFGEEIWDFPGNVRERVRFSDTLDVFNYNGAGITGQHDNDSLVIQNTFNGALDLSYEMISSVDSSLTNNAHNIGLFYILSGNQTGLSFTRGSNHDFQNGAGLYSGDIDTNQNHRSSSAGFRCVYRL